LLCLLYDFDFAIAVNFDSGIRDSFCAASLFFFISAAAQRRRQGGRIGDELDNA
jgi:hypothetical protein